MGIIYRNGTYYGDNKSIKDLSTTGKTDKDVNGDSKGEIFNSYYGTDKNIAIGDKSHAEGVSNESNTPYSHTEGYDNVAAEGSTLPIDALRVLSNIETFPDAVLSGPSHSQHVEGRLNASYGVASHAEGNSTLSCKLGSHSEGQNNCAYGNASHTEGSTTISYGTNSHAEGLCTIAASPNQHVQGKSNVVDFDSKYAMIIGGGTGGSVAYGGPPENRKNIFTVDWNGNIECGVSDSLGNFLQKGKINGIGLVICSQEEYDQMESHDSSTLYIIGD